MQIDDHDMVFFRNQIHFALRLIEENKYAQAIMMLQNTELSMSEKIQEKKND